ncbi:MAG: TolC family protein [Candidatus Latescibacteria bacterium]|nr:TolC family protein [Candidatus Latescibacterota bacterium]MBT4139316.1 TolC family protein [Candidatus Latescibacterota bacterium]
MFIPISKWAGFTCLILSALSVNAESLTRADALQIALRDNPDLMVARASWQAEKARALQTWALPPPELELEYEGMPGIFKFGQHVQRTVGLSQQVAFPVTWWQRHQAAQHLADAVYLSVYEVTRLNIARDICLAYDRALADQQILHLAEKHVQLSEEFFERAQTRFDAGDIPKLDVMRAEVAFVRLQSKLTVAKNTLSVSRSKINVLLGKLPQVAWVLADSLSYVPASFDLDHLSAEALRLRRDLRATTHTLQSAKARQSAAKLSFLPDVSFHIARQTTLGSTGPLKSWRTGFVFELPLWSMFEQRGKIVETSAQYKKAMAKTEQIKLRVLQEVHTAYIAFQATAQRMTLMQERIRPTAERAYSMARQSYDVGEVSYLDLLDVQRDVIEIGIEYLETLFAYRSAQAKLFHAVGKAPASLNTGNSK